MNTILPALRPLRTKDPRTDAIERLMAIEESMHALIRACDAAGLKDTADALAPMLEDQCGSVAVVYMTLCRGN